MSGIINSAGSRSGVIGETELDYEEGTWTPATSTSGYTISSQDGTYIKIGKQIFIHGNITLSAVDGSSNSTFVISGFPFTSHATFAGVGSSRDDTTLGTFYLFYIALKNNVGRLGSMDGISNGSQRTIRTCEKYLLTTNYEIP